MLPEAMHSHLDPQVVAFYTQMLSMGLRDLIASASLHTHGVVFVS